MTICSFATMGARFVHRHALIISCFNWYKTRLEPVRELLIARDYEVTVLIADFDHIKKALLDKQYEECTYVHVPPYQSNLSAQRIRSHLVFGKKTGKVIREIQPALIWLQMPPNNQARFCIQYKKQHPDTVLITDIIDLWPESMPLGAAGKTQPARIWKRWRDCAIEMADYTFTECDLYREKLSLDPAKSSTLYLFKKQSVEQKEMVLEMIRQRKADKGKIRLAYLGSMNNIIDIEGICNIIRQLTLNGCQCELQAIGDGSAKESFIAAVKETGCETHFHGIIFDEKEKIRILAGCDYGLNMMKDTSAVGLTIKSIDYLSYGLPLINNIKGDTWRMVEQEGIGMNVIPGSFALEVELNHEHVRTFFEDHFSYEIFTRNVETQLKRIIKDQ